MTEVSIDFESRSTVDLKRTGVYPYARHLTTDLWCMAYAFPDEEPLIWRPGMPFPERLGDHIASGGVLRAWNANFERQMWQEIGVPRYGFPPVSAHQWVDTAAEAAAMSLPRALDKAAAVTGISEQKDGKGYRLMIQMAKPKKVEDDGTIIWWDDETRREQLEAYCQQDVRTERRMAKVIRRLTAYEQGVYALDQRINDRGVRIDLPLVLAAKDIVAEGMDRANRDLRRITRGYVTSVTQRLPLLDFARSLGLDIESLAKKSLAETLTRDDILPAVREALELRQEAGRTSVSKLDAFVNAVGQDGRVRGIFLYCGANTGRWAGKLLQPHNFPRGEVEDIESFIPAVLERDYDALDMIAPPIVIVLSMLRSMIIPSEGHDFLGADFSAIEAVVLNWLADEREILEDFRAYFAGDKSRDPYKKMAVRMGRAERVEDVTKDDRQAGKAGELGCGFQMGWPKFKTSAWEVYGVRVTDEQAQNAVAIYRDSHQKVKAFWKEIENAAIEAVENPGASVIFGPLGNLRFVKKGGYLYLVLPSGRPLAYASPKIVQREVPWSTKENPQFRPAVQVRVEEKGQWVEQDMYGGLWTENVVQATARDFLVAAMFKAEEHGLPVVLHVHDELVTEVPKTRDLSPKEFESILKSSVPEWGRGCPIGVEAWRGSRYRK